MNLIELRRKNFEVRELSDQIRRNLTSNKSYRYSYLCSRSDPGIRLIHRLKTNRSFAKQFSEIAVKRRDISDTLHLINSNPHTSDDWLDILENLFGVEFYFCDDCSQLFLREDTSYSEYADGRFCSDCFDNNDGYDEEEEDQSYEYIGGRHSSKRKLGHIPSAYDQRKPRVLLGLELEMEVNEDYDLDNKAGYILEKIGHYKTPSGDLYRYALMEEDCSIDRGFEMVTGYTGLDVHKNQLKLFKSRLHGCTSHNTSTCGLHIHICKNNMTMLHASKLILFMNDPDNADLVYALARRRDNGYCKTKARSQTIREVKQALNHSDKIDQLCSLNDDRYEMLNFQNEKTIEYRLFRGSLKYSTIMACLEFTFATWHFARIAGTTNLKTKDFLEFICKPENRIDTRFLRGYLKNKGFTLAYESKQKPQNDDPSAAAQAA